MSWVESPVRPCLVFSVPKLYLHVLIYINALCMQEGSGFVAVKTGNLVIFGSYSSSMYPSVCVEAVEKLGKL